MLLTPSGKMCCLGFAAKVLGCTDTDIEGRYYPAGTKKILDGLTKASYGDATISGDFATGHCNGVRNTEFSRNAAKINDEPNIAEPEREQQLIDLAKENGFEFVFVN